MATKSQKKAEAVSDGVPVRIDEASVSRYQDGVPVRIPDEPEQTAGSDNGQSAGKKEN